MKINLWSACCMCMVVAILAELLSIPYSSITALNYKIDIATNGYHYNHKLVEEYKAEREYLRDSLEYKCEYYQHPTNGLFIYECSKQKHTSTSGPKEIDIRKIPPRPPVSDSVLQDKRLQMQSKTQREESLCFDLQTRRPARCWKEETQIQPMSVLRF